MSTNTDRFPENDDAFGVGAYPGRVVYLDLGSGTFLLTPYEARELARRLSWAAQDTEAGVEKPTEVAAR